jgi:hypothetical protein
MIDAFADHSGIESAHESESGFLKPKFGLQRNP